MTYRLTFSKTGRLRFVGHLDMTEALRRAVRRAGLPVKYSGGFIPHMELKIASPLPLGMEGYCEYADLLLTEEIDENEICERLNGRLPDGLTIKEAARLPDGAKSTAALLRRAEYEMRGGYKYDDVQLSIDKIMASGEIFIEKKAKTDVKTVNIRKDIHDLCLADGKITTTLSLGSEGSLSPVAVARLVLGDMYETVIMSYARKKLLLTTDLTGQD